MTNPVTIGGLIEYEVRKRQIPINKFAEMICCRRNNVYDIFRRNDINIMQLKRISKVLNHNFFKDIAENVELINAGEETKEELMKRKAVSQFLDVVPDILHKFGKPSTIVFCKLDESGYEDCKTPDMGLPDPFITFTIGETLRERIGDCAALQITSVTDNDGYMVEVCENVIYGSICVNVKLDYRTADEWSKIMALAFETYDKFVTRDKR